MLNLRADRQHQVPMPPLNEQRRIVDMLVSQSTGRSHAEEARRDALEILFDSLLHDLMTARLRVPVHLARRPVTSLASEAAAVQYPMVRYATDIGWTYLSPDDAVRLRRGETRPVLCEVLVEQLQRLNPGIVDLDRAEQVAKALVQVQPTIEGNLDAWEYLRGLKTVFVPDEKPGTQCDACSIVERPERNTFHVTPEFSFTNGTKTIRPDVVFLVNGIPVIVVEAKAATKQSGMADAFDQIVRYHRAGPELLALMQVHSLSQLVHFYYGATWSFSRKTAVQLAG